VAPHLSPAFFLLLFKRETGMSFIAYVTVVRMEKAAELLRGTEDKTYRIADRPVSGPQLFQLWFKKHFGVSPTKFRAG
jgi:two-component system response regulator YesN